MNKIFKVVWSKSKQCYVVVSEIAKNTTGKKKIIVGAILAVLATQGYSVMAAGAGTPNKNNNTWGATTPGGVAIGPNTTALGATAIDPATGKARVAPSIAIGLQATSEGLDTITIGVNAGNSKSYGISMGKQTNVGGDYGIAIGYQTSAMSDHAVAIGEQTRAPKMGATVMGVSARGYGQGSVSLGWQALAGADVYGPGININSNPYTDSSTDIANYQKWGDTAVGLRAVATGGNATALGRSARAAAENAIAIGGGDGNNFNNNTEKTEATASKAIAMGYNAKASNSNALSLGVKATASGSDSVSLGTSSKATDSGSIAIGETSESTDTNSVALGYTSKANGASATAIGPQSQATKTSAVALGRGAMATEDYAVAIGDSASATITKGVALGYKSKANTASGVAGYNANTNRTNTYAGLTGNTLTSTLGAVSIGDGTNTRQITGLAAGTNDTDAVNVAQLKSVNLAFTGDNSSSGDVNLANSKLAVTGDNTYITTAAANQGLVIKAKKETITVSNGTASASIGVADARNVADSINQANADQKISYKANGGTTNSVKLTDGFTFNDGKSTVATVANNGQITYDLNAATKKSITDSEAAVKRTISLGADSGPRSSQSLNNNNVAFDVKGKTGSYITTAMVGDTLTVNTTRGAIQSDTAGTASLSGADGLATAQNVATAINKAKEGSAWNLAVNTGAAQKVSGGNKVTFKDGKNISLTQSGTTITVGTTDQLTADNVTVGTGANQIVLNGTNGEVSGKSIKAGNSTLNTNGLTISGGPSVTSTGINAGNKVISGVSQGVAGTDAVNKNQMDAAIKTVADSTSELGKNTITLAAQSGSTTGQALNSATGIKFYINGESGSDALISTTASGTNVSVASTQKLKDAVTQAANAANKDLSNLSTAGDTHIKDLAKTAATWNVSTNGSNNTAVAGGETVNFINGDNIAITNTGRNITIGTAKNVSFDKVTVGGVTIDKTDGINAGGKEIKGIADGTAADSAVSKGQMDAAIANAQAAASSTEKVVAKTLTGDNNLATVTGQTGTAKNETYEVAVSENAVKAVAANAAQDAVKVAGTGLAIVSDVTAAGVKTYTVNVDEGKLVLDDATGNIGAAGSTQGSTAGKNGVATTQNVAKAINDAVTKANANNAQALADAEHKFDGDTGTTSVRKHGEVLSIKGGVTTPADLTTGNIGVVSDGAGTLNVRLAKVLTGLTSATYTDGAGNTQTVTGASSTITDGAGKTTTMTKGGLSTTDGTKTTTVAPSGVIATDGSHTVKLEGTGIDAGNTELKNVAAGTAATSAVNKQQMEDAVKAGGTWKVTTNTGATTEVTGGDTVDFINGDNISITNTGRNITIGTAKTVSFDKVTVGGVTIDKTDGINAGGKEIKGIADGTAADSAVSKGQMDAAIANAQTAATSTEKVVAKTLTGDNNLATVTGQTGTAKNETYEVAVSENAVKEVAKTAAQDAVKVAGTGLATVSDATAAGVKTYTVNVDEGKLVLDDATGNIGAAGSTQGTTAGKDGVATTQNVAKAINDAVTKANANNAQALADAEHKFDGDTGTTSVRKHGEVLSIKGGVTTPADLTTGNIGVVSDGAGTLNVRLAKVLTGLTSATYTDGAGNTQTVTGASSTITDGAGNTTSMTKGGLSTTDGKNTTTVAPTGVTATDGSHTVKLEGTGIDAGNTELKNVAAGTAATSAVNKQQMEDAISKATGDATHEFGGDDTTVVSRKHGEKLNIKGGASTVAADLTDGNIAVLGDATTGTLNLKLAKALTGLTSATYTDGAGNTQTVTGASSTITDGAGNTTSMTKGGLSTTDGTKTTTVAPSGMTATDGTHTVKVEGSGIDASNTELKNVAAGTAATSAVNKQQMEDAVKAGGTWKVTTNTGATTEVTGGDTVDFINGDNIAITNTGRNITIGTAKNVSFDKVTVGGVTIDKTDGINAGGKEIKGIADGTAADSAVSKGQMETAIANAQTAATSTEKVIAKALTGDTNLATVTGQTGTAKGETYEVAVSENAVKNVAKAAAQDAVTVTGTGLATVSDNTVAGVKTYTVNVGEGKLVIDDTTGKLGANGATQGTTAGKNGVATTQDVASVVNSAIDKTKQALDDAEHKFDGDTGTTSVRKHGEVLSIKGGVTTPTDLTTGNIGVVSDGAGTLNIRLAKALTGLTSATYTDGSGNTQTVTGGSSTITDGAGNTTTITKGGLSTTDGSKTTTVAPSGVTATDGTHTVKLEGTGIDAGNTELKNVAAGTAATSAVNKQQMEDAISKATGDATHEFGGDDTTVVSRKHGEKLNIKGGASTVAADLTDGNIAVLGDATTGTLNLKLAKALTGLTSATYTDGAGNTQTVTGASSTITDGAGNTTALTKGGLSTTDGKNTTTVAPSGVTATDGTHTVKLEGTGIDAGNTELKNVAAGTAATSAVNKQQMEDAISKATGDATHEFGGDDTTVVSRKHGEKLNIKGGASTAAADLTDGNIAVLGDATTGTLNLKLAKALTGLTSATYTDGAGNTQTVTGASSTITDGAGKTTSMTKDGLSTTDGTNTTTVAPTGVTATDGTHTVKLEGTGIDAGNTELKNVAAGKAATSAVNKQQMEDAISKATGDATHEFGGDDTTVVSRKHGEKLNIKGGASTAAADITDGNIAVLGDATTGTLNLKLAKALTGLTSATYTDAAGNTTTVTGGTTTIADAAGNTQTLAPTKSEIKDNAGVSTVTTKDGVTAKDGSGNTTALTKGGVSATDGNGHTTDLTKGGLSTTDGTNTTTVAPNGLTATDGTNTVKVEGSGIDAGGTEIKNVAAGTTATSAVNKGQMDDAISKATGDATHEFGGDDTTVVSRKHGEKLNIKGGASTAAADLTDGNIAVIGDATTGTLNLKLAKALTGLTSATYTDAAGNTTTVTGGTTTIADAAGNTQTLAPTKSEIKDNAGVSTVTTKDGVTAKDAAGNTTALTNGGVSTTDGAGNTTALTKGGLSTTDGKNTTTVAPTGMTATDGTHTVKVEGTGIDAGNTEIKNVAAGTTATSAVNKGQMDDAISKATADATHEFAGDTGNNSVRKHGEVLSIKGGVTDTNKLSDNNIGVVSDGAGTLSVKLAKDLKDLTSATYKDTAGNTTTVTGGTTTIADASGNTQTLSPTKSEIKDNAGVSTVTTKDGVTAKDGSGNTTVLTKGGLSTTDGTNTTTVTPNGLTATDGTKTVKVNGSGIDAGNTEIKNVADGTTPHSAINKNQLDAAVNQLQNATDNLSLNVAGNNGTGNVKLKDQVLHIDGTNGITTKANGQSVTVGLDDSTMNTINNTAALANNAAKKDLSNVDQAGKSVIKDTAAWNVKVNSATSEVVKGGDTVTFNDGHNIMITNNGKDITVATKKEVTFDKVSVGGITIDKQADHISGVSSITGSGSGAPTMTFNAPNGSTPANVSMNSNLDMGGKQINNVGPATRPTDAVNKQQVDQAMKSLAGMADSAAKQYASKAGANAAALAALKPIQYDPLAPTQIMAGIGNYKSQTAVALGVAHYSNEDTMFNIGASLDSHDTMLNAGVTHKFGSSAERKAIPERYKGGPISSIYVMQDEVSTLKEQNSQMQALLDKQSSENAAIVAENKILREQNEEMQRKVDLILSKLQ